MLDQFYQVELSAESDSSEDKRPPGLADLTKSNADSWPDALLHLLYLWFLSFFLHCGAVHPAGWIYRKQNLWQCAWVTMGSKYSHVKVVKPSVECGKHEAVDEGFYGYSVVFCNMYSLPVLGFRSLLDWVWNNVIWPENSVRRGAGIRQERGGAGSGAASTFGQPNISSNRLEFQSAANWARTRDAIY